MSPASSPIKPMLPPAPSAAPSRSPHDWSVIERYGVCVSLFVRGSIVAWAGWVLPWRSWTLFSLVCCALAVADAATVLLVATRGALAWRTWRLSAWVSLLLFASATGIVGQSSVYLIGVYGQLGAGLSAALVAIWGLAVLLTVPLGVWGLVRTRHVARWRWRPAGPLLALLIIASLLVTYRTHARASGTRTFVMDDAELLIAAQSSLASLRKQSGRRLRPAPTVRCDEPVDAERLTLLLGYVAKQSERPRVACLQAADGAQLVQQLRRHLEAHAARGYLKLDLVTQVAELNEVPPLIRPLALRPGLDGLCWEQRCAAPWQLLARGAFVRFRPLEFLQDLRLGVSFDELRGWLKVDDTGAPSPTRIATRSYSIDSDSNITQLVRMRPPPGPLTRDAVETSLQRFEDHVTEAQANNGTFRYTLEPFTGKAERRHFNLARQAGTALVLCELGTDIPRINRSIERALAVFERHERPLDEVTAGLSLQESAARLRLASSALPLTALLRCRSRVGPRFDDLIGKLTRFVLRLQRPNGDFFPEFDLRKGEPRAGPHPLFAPGQAILALILADNELDATEHGLEVGQLGTAVKRAMDYVANEHWRTPVASFFFIEENWHCLAAREALLNHRHPLYERFCLDYMQFKRRHILEAKSRVSAEFVGGFGFGNVVPPHNTGTAGFAEAMAAAIAVKQARQDDITADVALLRQAVAFLIRQQWSPSNCFACVRAAIGAISEHTHSPITRIDFVQHAWAAVGHSLPWLE